VPRRIRSLPTCVKGVPKAGEAAWDITNAQLESEWKGFETDIKKYFETFGKDIKQQHAVFQSQVTAQMNAWHETAISFMQGQRNLRLRAGRTSTRPYRA
jgi:hypothetical protein